MSPDELLDNTDESSKHIVMYDKQRHQITPLPNHIKCYKVKFTPLCFTNVTVWNLICSRASCFHVNDHCETSAPNQPKITLRTKRSKVVHTHITTASDS